MLRINKNTTGGSMLTSKKSNSSWFSFFNPFKVLTSFFQNSSIQDQNSNEKIEIKIKEKSIIKEFLFIDHLVQAIKESPEHAMELIDKNKRLIVFSRDMATIIEASPQNVYEIIQKFSEITLDFHGLLDLIKASPQNAIGLLEKYKDLEDIDVDILMEDFPQHKEALETLFPEASQFQKEQSSFLSFITTPIKYAGSLFTKLVYESNVSRQMIIHLENEPKSTWQKEDELRETFEQLRNDVETILPQEIKTEKQTIVSL